MILVVTVTLFSRHSKMFSAYLKYWIIFSFLVMKMEMISVERNENFEINEKNHENILSRHRRYLTFPEGSSLQLGKFCE